MLLVVTLGFVPTVNAAIHGFEVGTVFIPATDATVPANTMTTVTLDQTYNNPLVFALTTNQGGDPVAIRVANITGNTFDIAQFEPTSGFDPGDSTHRDMTISYFVIDEGTYDLGNGLVIEAGRISTTTTVQQSIPPAPNTPFPSSGGFTTINFATTFNNTPTVLVDIQTDNNNALVVDSNPSPWLTTAARNADINSIEVSLERASVAVGPIPLTTAEDIGYVAIETGEYTITDTFGTDITLLALITDDVITGWDNTNGATSGVNIGFGATDLGPYLRAIDSQVSVLSGISRVPSYYLISPSLVNPPSAETALAADQGLVRKAQSQTKTWGESYEEVSRLVLLTQGDTRGELGEVNIESVWMDPRTRSEAQIADAAVKWATLGIPNEELWTWAGASPEEVARWRTMNQQQILTAAVLGAPTTLTEAEAAQEADPEAPPTTEEVVETIVDQ